MLQATQVKRFKFGFILPLEKLRVFEILSTVVTDELSPSPNLTKSLNFFSTFINNLSTQLQFQLTHDGCFSAAVEHKVDREGMPAHLIDSHSHWYLHPTLTTDDALNQQE